MDNSDVKHSAFVAIAIEFIGLDDVPLILAVFAVVGLLYNLIHLTGVLHRRGVVVGGKDAYQHNFCH